MTPDEQIERAAKRICAAHGVDILKYTDAVRIINDECNSEPVSAPDLLEWVGLYMTCPDNGYATIYNAHSRRVATFDGINCNERAGKAGQQFLDLVQSEEPSTPPPAGSVSETIQNSIRKQRLAGCGHEADKLTAALADVERLVEYINFLNNAKGGLGLDVHEKLRELVSPFTAQEKSDGT